MSQQPYPEWMRPAFDQRFNELALASGRHEQNESIRQKQDEMMEQLKRELTELQYRMMLEWDESLNYRNAVEKELMYLAGLKDGMKIIKQLQDFLLD